MSLLLGGKPGRAAPCSGNLRTAAPPARPARTVSTHVASPANVSSAATSSQAQKLPSGSPVRGPGPTHAASGIGIPEPSTSTAKAIAQEVKEVAAAASKCPFTQLKSAIAGTGAQPASPTSGTVPIPGPPPLSFAALQDVSVIFTRGLHNAMLRFDERYGPVCRWGVTQRDGALRTLTGRVAVHQKNSRLALNLSVFGYVGLLWSL